MTGNTERVLDRVMAECAVREVGCRMSAHHFHSYYELFFVEQGSVRFMIGGGSYELNQADFLLIPPRMFHCTQYPNKRCVRSVIYFHSQDINRRVLKQLPDSDSFLSRPQILHIAREVQPQFFEIITRLTREDRQPDQQSEGLMYFYLQELFLLLSRYGEARQELPFVKSISNEQVLSAARFIQLNYMHPISAADIASASGFSPNHLSKKFRETAGISTHEYLIQVRLQHAALALSSTEDSITQIALRCGYSDSNYFKDVFKKRYGLSPRDYRKRQQESHK